MEVPAQLKRLDAEKLAYIIRGDLAYRLGKTEVGYFDDDLKALNAFLDRSDAYPGTFMRATRVSGTYIPPEVMPRRLRLARAKAMYDWLDLRGGGTLDWGPARGCTARGLSCKQAGFVNQGESAWISANIWKLSMLTASMLALWKTLKATVSS